MLLFQAVGFLALDTQTLTRRIVGYTGIDPCWGRASATRTRSSNLSGMSESSPPVPSGGVHNAPCVDRAETNLAAELPPHPTEVQVRGTRMTGRARVVGWRAVGTEDSEMSDDGLQAAPIPRGADHGVGSHARPIAQDHLDAVQVVNVANNPGRPVLEGGDEPVIDSRVAMVLEVVGVQTRRRSCDPISTKVAERKPLHQFERLVNESVRQVIAEIDEKRLTRDPEELSRGKIGRCPHRDGDLRACLDQVTGDVESRVASTDDQYIAAAITLRSPEFRGMDEFGLKCGSSGPGGKHGDSVPPGRDDEVAAPHLAGVCEQSPKFTIAFYAQQLCFEADPYSMFRREAIEILNDVIAGRVAPIGSGHAFALKLRHRSPRVEAKLAISRSPA